MTKSSLREEWKKETEKYAIKAVQFGHENAMLYDMLYEIGEYWLSKLTQALTERDEELRVKIEGMNRDRFEFTKIAPNERPHEVQNVVYNHALSDVLSLLKDKDI